MKRAWALLSVVPIFIGSCPIAAWLTGNPKLVQLTANYFSIPFNPACCFILSGLALVLCVIPGKFFCRLQIIFGALIFIIAGLTVAQDILQMDLHIDEFYVKSWVKVDSSIVHAGRMAPNTALAFMLTGLVFVLFPYAKYKFVGTLIEIAIFMLFLISILGVSGYILKMEFLYSWYGYTRMLFAAAVNFLLLSLGLGGIWRSKPESSALYQGREDTRIMLLSSAILLCMAVAITLTNFATLFQRQNTSIGQSLQQLVAARSAYFENEVMLAVHEMDVLRGNTLFQQEVARQNQNPTPSSGGFSIQDNNQLTVPPVADFQPILKLFIEEGFSGVSVFDKANKQIATTGNFIQRAEFNVQKKTNAGFIDTVWNNGWFLQVASNIIPDNKNSGVLIVEWPLHNVDKVFAKNQVLGATGDIKICIPPGPQTEKAICYSVREGKVVNIPQKVANQFTSAHYALANGSGLITVYNENYKRVLAAYGSIPNLGLSMIVTMEVSEIYQPIIAGLYSMIPVILLTILIGLVLLRLQVIPLLRRVINAEKGLLTINKRLQDSEERYALAVRGSHIGLWDWDISDDKVFYSPYFKGMLGYGDNEFKNNLDSFKSLLHPDDYDRVFDLVQQHLVNQAPYDVEYRLKRKSGDYHWFHAVGQALWDDRGNATRMAGSLTDITERKRAEQRLAAQFAVIRILSEAQNIEEVSVKILQALCERLEWEFGSMWMVDSQANLIRCIGLWYQPFLEANALAQATQNMQLPMGVGLAGRVWETAQQLWVYDVTADKNFPYINEAKAVGMHSAFSFPIMVQNKVLGVLEFLTRQRQTPDEAMLKMMSAITAQIGQFIQRKFAESSFRENENYKTAILEAASDSIMTINELGTILSYNPRTLEIFDYSRSDLKNKNIDLLLPDLSKKLKHLVGKLAAEFIAVRRNGENFPAELTLSRMYLSRQNVFVCIIRDITERKKVEKLKNEFVSVVSHELRTPLTSIRGSLGLLLGGTVGGYSEKAKKLLDIANNNCERLLLLINDILDIEKIEAGKMDFHLVQADILDMVKDSIEANKLYAEKFGVKVNLVQYESGVMVTVDPARLMQVMTNLISNAVKYTSPNGKVDISVIPRGEIVRVTITDYGAGVPDNFRSTIFQKFSQADSSSNRNQSGTGLGLSISKTIVEKFGGTINFTSKPDKETIFYFDLPKAHTDLSKEVEEPVKTESSDKILICEDDQDQAEYLRELLKSAGIYADIAYTVAQAKALLAERHYHGLLLDLLLPDQDGIAFIRQLRDDEKTRSLPVIVLSVLAQTGRALLNGDAISVIDWLDKPVDFNKLLKSIERIKQQHPDKMPRILHVEDNPDTRQIIATLLQEQAQIIPADSLAKAREKLSTEEFDFVILDLLLPDGNGTELLPMLAKQQLPVIVFSSVELDREYARYVTQALIKAETSDEYFLNTIKKLIDSAI
ncbi:MAG: PAS domain S-box protein [Pseudomonadota bacterium]